MNNQLDQMQHTIGLLQDDIQRLRGEREEADKTFSHRIELLVGRVTTLELGRNENGKN